jgi:hypothetical protein
MRPHAWHDTSASAASDKWAEAYWDRQTPTSFKGHQQLFEAFSAAKLRVRNRKEADRFLACNSENNASFGDSLAIAA